VNQLSKLINCLSARDKIILSAFLLSIITFLFGERMRPFGILGDEVIYYFLSADFMKIVFEAGLDKYYVQRIFPPFIVYYFAKLFSVTFSPKNIIYIYGVINVILQVGLAYIWSLVADEMKISRRGLLVGFIALFCNFAVLKYVPYTQITTDLFAYTFSLLLFYFYLKDNCWAIAGISILSAFTWPALFYMGIILLMFPCVRTSIVKVNNKNFANIIPAIVLILIILQYKVALKGVFTGEAFSHGIYNNGANKPNMSLIFFSIAGVLVYLFFALRGLLLNPSFEDIKFGRGILRLRNIIIAVAVFMVTKYLIGQLSRYNMHFDLSVYLENRLIAAVNQPFIFLISHFIYFGPMVFFIIYYWKEFCQEINKYGVGLVFLFVLMIVLSIDSESRHLVNYYPLFVCFIVKAMDDKNIWDLKKIIFFALISIFFSKIWLPIHLIPWQGEILSFPKQLYYMNFGPWMSNKMFYAQLIFVLAGIAMLYFTIIKPEFCIRLPSSSPSKIRP